MSESMLETLRALRAAYGATMSDDECVELINAAAWAHREAGYGLSRKEAGTHGTRYDGQACCHDVIMLPNGKYWDCLVSAGGVSTPTWGAAPNGTITDVGRGWIAPIVPQDSVGPPEPITPPLACRALTAADVRAAVQAELAPFVAMLSQVLSVDRDILEHLGTLLRLAEQQEIRREALAVHADEALIARTTAWPLRASGRLAGMTISLTGTVGDQK